MEKLNTHLQTKSQKRLLEIYNLLAQGKSYKAQELAEQFACSRKTVSNDLKPLVESGVLKYKAHYYTMLEEYCKEHKHRQSDVINTMINSMLKKVMPNIVDDKSAFFYFDFEMEAIENESVFIEIMMAISKKTALSFQYISRSARESHKTVYPLKVSNFSGAWYLSAYDLEKEEIRTYYLLNITHPESHEDDYLGVKLRERLESQAKDIDSPWYGTPKKSVTLHVEDLALVYIKRRKYHNIEVLEDRESMLIVKFSYYQETEVLNFVKSWLPSVHIVDNPSLENKLKALMEKYLETL